jgi:Sulfotransferase family
MERHQLVFLAGLHRSGTTLLARLLAAHPEISGFSDTGVAADEGQHLQTLYPAAQGYGGPGRFGFAPESHLTETSPLVSDESARALFGEWSSHWDLARPFLVEKSPPNLLKTRFLQALFPRSSFVVVLRHPIPVSLATAKWRRTRRYHRLLEHSLHCYELFAADRERLERVHVIRYEELVREPEAVLQGIFDFLGLEPIPPGEPVEAGADERYFQQWQELKRDPRMRLYLTLASLRYERRARRFGYSLLRPERSR